MKINFKLPKKGNFISHLSYEIMVINMKNIVIPIDKDFNSTLSIGSPAFPLQMFYDDLQNYTDGFVSWHKQKQIEISLVIEGGVRLNELGKEFFIQEGEGFAVLPGVLHAVKPQPGRVARYVTFIFDPVILYGYEGSDFDNSFYTPLRKRKNAVCLLQTEKAKPALDALRALYLSFSSKTVEERLAVQRKVQDLWMLLFQQYMSAGVKTQAQEAGICRMIHYLHENYAAKFSLDRMAEHHHVSRGECCRYFKKMMGMTIVEYLQEYRISKAIELLENTDMTVTEISQAVGIGGASYFIASFKDKMGITPLKYRESCKR